AKGEVIGINTIKVQMIPGQGGAVEGMGFAIPADTVLRITEELIAHGRVQRGWLGIEIEVPESLPEEAPEGIVITEVIPGGPADQAGLQTGDLLVGLDGKPVPTLVDLVRVLEAHRPQDRILVRFRRDDQEALASLVLAPL